MRRQDNVFVTTASWEPRFLEGAKIVLEEKAFSVAVCFWFEEFSDRTQQAREEFEKLVTKTGAQYVPVRLRLFSVPVLSETRTLPSYASTWISIYQSFLPIIPRTKHFVLDISTMPREALWIALDLLTEAQLSGEIVYHRAKSHGEWCGSEPERPHIVPKLGGIPSLDADTRLLIVSGYDEDRSEQFISSFEPDKTLLLFQEGGDDENADLNEKKHHLRFGGRLESIQMGKIDCYEEDWGFARLDELTRKFAMKANLIIASLGPKTSAVALYRLHRRYPQSSLVYAPCREYNESYSEGIAATLEVDWNGADIISNAEIYEPSVETDLDGGTKDLALPHSNLRSKVRSRRVSL